MEWLKSGIPHHEPLPATLLPKGKIMDAKTMISWLQPEKVPPRFQPGEKYEYNNTAYVLLAEIIERVSGIPFPEFMKARVFTPLDMGDTEVFNQLLKENEPKERVFGFEKEFIFFGKNIPDDLPASDGIAGDRNVYASALDLLKWDVALTKGTLLPKEFYNQAYESGILNSGKKTGYGFGWHCPQSNQSRQVPSGCGLRCLTFFTFGDRLNTPYTTTTIINRNTAAISPAPLTIKGLPLGINLGIMNVSA
ncbi:MAG: serine hydrolase domain-containing protein [Calothrix sp. MO_192.B10]|nr:serine hydrolase domain-containing protein [Calothrix sp. MO_192.B10]